MQSSLTDKLRGCWHAVPLKLVLLLVVLSLTLKNPEEGKAYKEEKAEYYAFSWGEALGASAIIETQINNCRL